MSDVTQLRMLAAELRKATAQAVAHHSWLAQTLDDCRVDVERLLIALAADGSADGPADGSDSTSARTLGARAELVLRTWREVQALIQAGRSRWHCPCGGRLVDVARPGRVVPYRGHAIEIPAGFAIPTCDRCAAEQLDADGAQRLDAILLASYMSLSAR